MTGNREHQEYNDAMESISTVNPTFELLKKIGGMYIDKTEYIYKMVKSESSSFYFVSRPRRWGKSLMCNTIRNLFEGKKELFDGLYIAEKTDYSFKKFPVLHFDFNNLPIYDLKAVGESLSYKVESASSKYDVKFTSDNPISDSKQPSNPYTVDTER